MDASGVPSCLLVKVAKFMNFLGRVRYRGSFYEGGRPVVYLLICISFTFLVFVFFAYIGICLDRQVVGELCKLI